MNLIKKLTNLIILTLFLFSSDLDAKCNKQLISDLSSTIKQLNKYSCINSIYRANLPWSCNKNAPKGWAKYYGLKIKNLEKQKGICSS